MNYLIKKTNKPRTIVVFDYNMDGYTFRPKICKEDYLLVNKVVIISPTLIDKILTIKFNALFNQILKNAFLAMDEEASSGDIKIVLDELEKLKAIVTHKYQKFLVQEKEKMFLKKINLLEEELKNKLILMEYNYSYEEEFSKGRLR